MTIIMSLVGIYVIPVLKTSKYHKEFEMFNDFIIDMVRAANQLFTPEQWETKKNYVLVLVRDYMNNKTSLGFTEEQVNALIEGIVREIKIADSI